MTLAPLERYQQYLERWTWEDIPWRQPGARPQSRYATLRRALELFSAARGRTVVELGTIRSYTHGGLQDCNTDNPGAWTPDAPERWDWGAGCFSRVAAECLAGDRVRIHTVDSCRAHLRRARVITHPYRSAFKYHWKDSRRFLQKFRGTADLVYLDTGDMTPIEPTAHVQLEEARIIVDRGLVPIGGLVLIDDVRNPTPALHGDDSGLGKSKYALPFLLANGFAVEMSEYQVLLVRTSGA